MKRKERIALIIALCLPIFYILLFFAWSRGISREGTVNSFRDIWFLGDAFSELHAEGPFDYYFATPYNRPRLLITGRIERDVLMEFCSKHLNISPWETFDDFIIPGDKRSEEWLLSEFSIKGQKKQFPVGTTESDFYTDFVYEESPKRSWFIKVSYINDDERFTFLIR
jgi:hypothetical protein